MTREERQFSFPNGDKTTRAYDIELQRKDNLIELLQDNIDMLKFDMNALRQRGLELNREVIELNKLLEKYEGKSNN